MHFIIPNSKNLKLKVDSYTPKDKKEEHMIGEIKAALETPDSFKPDSIPGNITREILSTIADEADHGAYQEDEHIEAEEDFDDNDFWSLMIQLDIWPIQIDGDKLGIEFEPES